MSISDPLLISENSRSLNAQLHAMNYSYGAGGHQWAFWLTDHVKSQGIKTVLDYGCGKGTLKPKLELLAPCKVSDYDPAMASKSELPDPAECVVCTNVLEHVEPEYLDSVMAHMRGLATRFVLVSVFCRAGDQVFPDGSPCRCIVRSESWWEKKLEAQGVAKAITPMRTGEFAAWIEI